jgi:hypothetical protein
MSSKGQSRLGVVRNMTAKEAAKELNRRYFESKPVITGRAVRKARQGREAALTRIAGKEED